MEQINNHSPWELKSHFGQIADTGDYDGSYEITNGKISLITNDDDEGLQEIVDALNNSGAKFYENNLELLDSHLTISALTERVKELEDGLREMHSCTYDLIEYCQDQTYVDFIEDLPDGAVEMNKAMDKARALLTKNNNDGE